MRLNKLKFQLIKFFSLKRQIYNQIYIKKMNNKALKFVVFALLIATIFARDNPYKQDFFGKEPVLQHKYAQINYTFDQVLDHSNYQNTTYWKQRYWLIKDYFIPSAGPVYLFICGQYQCQGVPKARQWIITLAQRTSGLILVLEHRFYGYSMPFGNDSLKTSNLKLLTSEQALSDLAYFINEVSINKMFGVNGNPWITVGGSYPGALSAWFRYKYPHLTIGAIASSAVVQSIEDFSMFDEQMYLSANKSGNYCWNAINDSSYFVQQKLKSNQSVQFKKLFPGGQNLKDDEFLFYWIDSIVQVIQYGARTNLCNNLKDKSQQDQFKYLLSIVNKPGNDAYDYGSFYLKNQSYGVSNGDSARAWYYQSCTEFGYWQTQSKIHPLRSSQINLNFYKRFCADIFGQGTWPKVERKNIETGGWNLKAFNLLMSNGDQDPWKWASVQKSQGNIISRVANCTDCAHCVDLYTPTTSDSVELKKIRDQQFLTLQQWISDYWRTHKQNKISKMFEKSILTQ